VGQLVEQVVEQLSRAGPCTARDLAAHLGRSRTEVNRILYPRVDLFVHDDHQPPRWRLVAGAPVATGSARVPTTSSSTSTPQRGRQLPLYPWQRRALHAWQAHERRGVIEAVTGSGKTRVGLAAIANALTSG
jgi:hypothetical protein